MTPEQELKELRSTITTLWYELYPESKQAPDNDDKAALLRVRNMAEDFKCTRWNYRVLNKAYNEMDKAKNEH